MQNINANLRNFIQIRRFYIKETVELRETVTSIYILIFLHAKCKYKLYDLE